MEHAICNTLLTKKSGCSGRVCDPTAGHRPAESRVILSYTMKK